MKNILFYKYITIDNLEELRTKLMSLCTMLDIKGKILLAKEGVNGCVSGSEEAIEIVIDFFRKDPRFSDIDFKITPAKDHTLKKLFIRVRDNVLRIDLDVDLKNTATYVEPKELKKWLDEGDDLIMIDARNNYESKIGKFKGAIAPDMDTFREWSEAVDKLKHLKHKKIVTYCTGGIRCEKASAYMKEQGFENVYQLHGGIIKYGQECGNEHWEGSCYVFDDRRTIAIDDKEYTPITTCVFCNTSTDNYMNCKEVSCDKMFIVCDSCNKKHKNACNGCV